VARKRIRNKPGSKANAVHVKESLKPKQHSYNGKSLPVIEIDKRRAEEQSEKRVSSENVSLTQRCNTSRSNLQAIEEIADSPTLDRDTSSPCDSNLNKSSFRASEMGEQEEFKSSVSRRRERKETKESRKERKTAKILAIITGIFIVCWLPFFINALVMPFCTKCQSKITVSICLWLGYVNSMLNPVIYTIFSPDFRNAFRKML
ncbi:5-hydroxytryptamine receptor-like protein, partial [Dinothrombium tinctorium]